MTKPEWMFDAMDLPSREERDRMLDSCSIFRDLDVRYAGWAVHGLRKQLERWSQEQEERVRLATHDDDYVEACHESVYFGAAESHAIIALICPTIEGVSLHGCSALRDFDRDGQIVLEKKHERWKLEPKKFWDSGVVWPIEKKEHRGKGRGLFQLWGALGVTGELPGSTKNLLSALFRYRNDCFHNGLEWPISKRSKFKAAVAEHGWTEWFSWSESSNRPWIAYLTKQGIDAALDLCDKLPGTFDQVFRTLIRKRENGERSDQA